MSHQTGPKADVGQSEEPENPDQSSNKPKQSDLPQEAETFPEAVQQHVSQK